jgi:histone-lysine N-methyltransferase MLL3
MGGPGMPGPSGMGMRGPGPPQGMGQHPALMRQDSNSVPPPPPLNTKAMTPPPENPTNEEDKNKVLQYEKWLGDQESAINQHLKYYETEISKLRKLRKSLSSKQRTMKKMEMISMKRTKVN